MGYLFIIFLAFAGFAQAQPFERDEGGGWHRRAVCCRRDEDGREFRRRHYVKRYRHYSWHYKRDEDGRGWRHSGKGEEDRGWWHPEAGWPDSELREGPRRCRPPMHAAGDADARKENALNMAIKSWQEQVINEHGERFLNYAAAYKIDEHCDPARVGESNVLDLKRCVITAAPCLTPPSADQQRVEEEGRPREEEHH